MIKTIVRRLLLVIFLLSAALLMMGADQFIPDTTDTGPDPQPLQANSLSPSLTQSPVYQDDMLNRARTNTATSLEPISLNFTSIRTRELLQIIAQFTKLNFLINDNVHGEMSIHLYRVPWTQALDVILKSQDLGERRVGDVIFIAPLADLMRQQINELEAKQRMQDLVPLEDRIIHLNYSDAADIQATLVTKTATLLSARGSTNVDKRTNSIWVRDTPAHIQTIITLVKQLDHPVKQVMIEARIVSIDRSFEKAIGARFGLSRPGNLSGSLQGANELVEAGGSVAQVPLTDRLNFNLPAAGGFAGVVSPATIGLAVAKLGSAFVDLELSALERQEELAVISSPRLITSNQQKAYIETGVQIPYQTAASSGATTISFQDAVLKLEVTPQITLNNQVILDLKVSNNSEGTPIPLGTDAGSAIPINTQEEQSRVLLNNNQTVVLGGVYTRKKDNSVTRIPFLGKLPFIGHFFSNTDSVDNTGELLIFLTPHVINKPSDMSSSY